MSPVGTYYPGYSYSPNGDAPSSLTSGKPKVAGVSEVNNASARIQEAGKKSGEVAGIRNTESEVLIAAALDWAPDSYRSLRESNWAYLNMSDGSFGYTFPNVGEPNIAKVPITPAQSLIGKEFNGLTVVAVFAYGHNHLRGDINFSGVDAILMRSMSKDMRLYLWDENGTASYLNSRLSQGRLTGPFYGIRSHNLDIEKTW